MRLVTWNCASGPCMKKILRLGSLAADIAVIQESERPSAETALAGRGKRGYIASIHAAMNHDYAPLTMNFERVIERSRRRAASNK